MTDADREAFLAGDRPDDVLVYLDEAAVSNPAALEAHGERVDDGIVLVLPGEKARSVFQGAAGIDPMAFAREAMDTDGEVFPNCTGGVCPESEGEEDASDDHRARFVFAFAEAENAEAGGLYAEGDVIHAYVSCACGESYSQKWVAGER
ncbi:MAG: DUF5807 family protein [Haloarculaceae archaeon]